MSSESRFSRWFPVLFGALLAVAFAAYVVYRQRYIGACDWFGYYELARLFRGGHALLDTVLPIDRFPSIVPLGFFPIDGKGLPQYPPGYPLLLALAGTVNAEFIVNPLVGVVSAIVLFLLARDLTGNRWVALATMGGWLFFPIVVFGSTTIMSDLVATLPLMGSYLLFRRGQLPWSALVLGTAFWVRPTNVLYCLPFALPLLRDHGFLGAVRYVLWMLPTALPYALYNHLLFGAPWRTGYSDISGDLTSEVFAGHLGFYLWQTAVHVGPLLPFLWFGLRATKWSDGLFYLLWSGIFIFFYSFWRSGGDVWWWIRFVLPGYPPLFFLFALGLNHLWRRTGERFPDLADRRWAYGTILALVLVTPFYQIKHGLNHRDLWKKNKGAEFHDVVRRVEKIAPAGSFVGSVEFGGSFRIYSQLVPFVSTHGNSFEVAQEAFARGREVFVVIEPWNSNAEPVQRLLREFAAVQLEVIELWPGGVAVYKLTKPAATPAVR